MSLQATYNAFDLAASTGQLCKGDNCCGWKASDLDTWHECPCNRAKGYAHPEDNQQQAYVILFIIGGQRHAVSIYDRKDHARQSARRSRDAGTKGIKIRRVQGADMIDRAEHQIAKYEDCLSD